MCVKQASYFGLQIFDASSTATPGIDDVNIDLVDAGEVLDSEIAVTVRGEVEFNVEVRGASG
jgi:hypothetical protein